MQAAAGVDLDANEQLDRDRSIDQLLVAGDEGNTDLTRSSALPIPIRHRDQS
jgi:hypothetical protein